jgi:hypothetical protein
LDVRIVANDLGNVAGLEIDRYVQLLACGRPA